MAQLDLQWFRCEVWLIDVHNIGNLVHHLATFALHPALQPLNLEKNMWSITRKDRYQFEQKTFGFVTVYKAVKRDCYFYLITVCHEVVCVVVAPSLPVLRCPHGRTVHRRLTQSRRWWPRHKMLKYQIRKTTSMVFVIQLPCSQTLKRPVHWRGGVWIGVDPDWS